MASAKALAVSSSKRHPRIAVVTSPRRRRRHHRRIVVRAERCRIATRAERERSSPSSPRCRRSAVMPSRRPCLSPSSLPVSSSSPSSERRATPRRIVASSPSSPSSFSLFWLPTTAFRGRHQHYPSLVCRSAPLSSPTVVAVVAAAITAACSGPIRPPSSSSRRHRRHPRHLRLATSSGPRKTAIRHPWGQTYELTYEAERAKHFWPETSCS